MRLRLVVLPVMAMIGLIPAARAADLDQARLRGSNVNYGAPDASYPIITTEPSYPGPSYPVSSPAARARSRPVAVAAPAAQLHNFTFELGARYWYSTGKLAKDLLHDR